MTTQTTLDNQTALDVIWAALETFIDPDTGVIYDLSLGRADLPTREQVLDDVPNPCGWAAGFEDAALNAGLMLPFAIGLAQRSGKQKWEAVAQRLADLVLKLATVSDTPGFLARGVLPDGLTYYRNSSADQYTMVITAMHALCQWEGAGAERQQQAAHFVSQVMALLEKHDWDIPTSDEKAGWVGETGQFWPDRATRLLQFAVADAALNPSPQTLARYRSLRDEAGSRRARGLFCKPGATSVPYAVLQTQVSLRLLYELEPDAEFKQVWRLAMHDLAENSILQLKARNLNDILKHIEDLPSLPEPVSVMELYDEEIYNNRHDLYKVSDFGGRFWNTNLRVHHEQVFIRQPLELAMCFALAGDNDLIDFDGNPLLPTALEYIEAITKAVKLEEIRLSHSAVSLFNAVAWVQNL